MARRVSRTFSRGPRRATDWGASTPLTTFVTVPASSAVLLEVFVPFTGGETIIRTRGLMTYRSDQVAASEVNIGAFGIGVVTAQAVSVGITAIPHPVTDAAWGGWLWHSYFANRFNFASATGLQFDGVFQIPVDSKAMRKIDEDERMVVVIENSTAVGMQCSSQERVLTKLH